MSDNYSTMHFVFLFLFFLQWLLMMSLDANDDPSNDDRLNFHRLNFKLSKFFVEH